MKILATIVQITVLYGVYYVGCMIQSIFHLSIPGSIIGMLLLFFLLSVNIVKEKWISLGGQFLLSNLAIFFVPSTVGLINYLPFFKGRGILTVFVTLGSTLIVMLLSGIIAQIIAQKQELRKVEQHERTFEV